MDSKQDPTNFNEKRKHPRIDASNEVEYILLDNNREKIGQGKGRTLNLSKKGALLETEKPLNGLFIILMSIDLDGNQVQVRGRLAHSRESEEPGRYLTGIKFTGSKNEHINAIVAFVKTYYRKKHSEQQ